MSREKILIKTSWISTIGNAVLSASKIVIGLWAGSLAVLGDGIDSATDVVISIVMIFTARVISRPPSKKYVFGYEKAEGIATKILSLVIFYAGVQMLLSAIGSIFSNETKEIPSPIAIYVTLFSIAGKLLLASYQWYNPARRLTWKVCRLRSMRINRSLSSKPSARTLKPKDILSNRLLYRLVPSVRPIEETESGSSLVTTASDYEKKRVKENRIRMAEYLRTNLLQTPTTVQRCEAPEKMKERALKKGYKNGTTYNSLLSQLVYGGLLPTPQAADSSIGAVIGQNDRFIITKNGMFRKVNQNGSNGSVGLGRIFHLMSTPTASDWKGGSTRKNPSLQRTSLRGEIHADYGIGKTSQLNPLFVEEMMGFPEDYLVLPFQDGDKNR